VVDSTDTTLLTFILRTTNFTQNQAWTIYYTENDTFKSVIGIGVKDTSIAVDYNNDSSIIVIDSILYNISIIVYPGPGRRYRKDRPLQTCTNHEGGSISGGRRVCYGAAGGRLTVAGYRGSVKRWEKSEQGGNGWTNIGNSNSSEYTAGTMRKTTEYRAVIGCQGFLKYSNSATITVVPLPVSAFDRSDITIDYNTTASYTISAQYIESGRSYTINYVDENGSQVITGTSNGSHSKTTGKLKSTTIIRITKITLSSQPACESSFGSTFTITVLPDPLPVKLTKFTATAVKTAVRLDWTTVSEIINEKFEVERSSNGFIFSKVGEVAGHGNYQGILNYSHLDKKPLTGLSFYRLRQVDFNGMFEYSPIVTATMSEYENRVSHSSIKVLPNPGSQDNLILQLSEMDDEVIEIKITNTYGQTVGSYSTHITGSQFGIPIRNILTAPVTAGIYVVTIKGNNTLINQRINLLP